MMSNGLVHIYTGNGKGKTTAAIGLAVRFFGTGKKVLFTQFLKTNTSSELKSLKKLGIDVLNPCEHIKFLNKMNDVEKDECAKLQHEILTSAITAAKSGEYKMIVLDEVLDAVNTSMLSESLLLDMIDECNGSIELILTGRNPSDEILKKSHYISEINCIRHPYEKGIAARHGIEY